MGQAEILCTHSLIGLYIPPTHITLTVISMELEVEAFLKAGCPSYHPTNHAKQLKAKNV